MGRIEQTHSTLKDASKIVKITIVITFILNLSTVHEWLSQKEASPATTSFLKLTEALKEIGDQFYLNTFRDRVRFAFIKKTNSIEVASIVENPLIPEVSHTSPREVAALENKNVIPENIDLTEADLVDDILDEHDEDGSQTSYVPTSPTESKIDVQPKKGLLIIGDSILKSGLQEHFERNLVKRDKKITMSITSKSGTGLSRPDVFNWIDFVANTKDRFDKTLIFLGTNDAQNLFIDKKVVTFGSKEWKEEYSARVSDLLKKACSKSKDVYWVSSLRMRSEAFDGRMRTLHDVVKRQIESQPSCAKYISTFQWFTKKSKYTDTWTTESKKNGKKTVKLRVSDGIHLTYWGADLFSQKLIDSIYE